VSLEELVLTMVLIGYEYLNDKDIQINGVQIILDAQGFTLRKAKRWHRFYLENMLTSQS